MAQPAYAPPPSTAGDDADARIAPDPCAAVLPALAALGAIASIASINWTGEDKTPERTKAKRKAAMALRDLETCCLGLVEIFRRFKTNPKLFAGEGALVAAPLKFGVHGSARVPADDARLYQETMNDVASMLVLAAQNSFDLMCAIEDGEIDAPEALFFAFGAAQERLNALFQTRASIAVAVETGGEVALTLTRLVRALKTHRVE